MSVVTTCYHLGVSTRRMDKLLASLGITTLSKSQVSEMAKELDSHVEEFRTRSLTDAGPFTFVAADALVLKVREGGRVVGVRALVATGVNNNGHREILGLHVTTSEDGAGWRSSATWSPAACPGSSSSPRMLTPGSWPRSAPERGSAGSSYSCQSETSAWSPSGRRRVKFRRAVGDPLGIGESRSPGDFLDCRQYSRSLTVPRGELIEELVDHWRGQSVVE